MTSEPDDLYELLGVSRDASAAEITRAYHRRARALHPDTHPGLAGEPARFRELEEAYRVLHDPARRAAYDRELRPPAPSPAAPPRRPAPAWWGPSGWPAARPPGWPAGAMLWAGPVQVIPPDVSSPASPADGAWLAVDPRSVLEWRWPW
ncbi:MAG TPA: J domain-containing protein [Streptosporangiaceae bacterium]|nr:J domain-containing protein [Streptosporangiaceae bacterium]